MKNLISNAIRFGQKTFLQAVGVPAYALPYVPWCVVSNVGIAGQGGQSCRLPLLILTKTNNGICQNVSFTQFHVAVQDYPFA